MFSEDSQPIDSIKPNVTCTHKVKYINQINGGLIMFFHNEKLKIIFLKLIGSIVNNIERINTKKGTQSKQFSA